VQADVPPSAKLRGCVPPPAAAGSAGVLTGLSSTRLL
jgi:hypothetical protein